MILLNQSLAWIISAITLILLEFLLYQPGVIYWVVPILVLTLFLALFQLNGRNFKDAKFWTIFLAPALFLLGSISYLVFASGSRLLHFIIILTALVILIYTNVVFLYIHRRPRYQPHTLENISSYLNVITIFFLMAAIFNVRLFFVVNTWYLLLVGISIIIMLVYQLFSISDIVIRTNKLFLLIISLVISEVFIVTNFLPTSVYVNALMVTLVYYVTAGLARNWLNGIKDKRVVLRYVSIGSIIFFIILISAKWI